MDKDYKQEGFNSIRFLTSSLGLALVFLFGIGVKSSLNSNADDEMDSAISSAILINDDNASIIDIESEYMDNINRDNILIIEMDDKQNISDSYLVKETGELSINDMAVELVGEHGNVTYYKLANDDNKILVNKYINSTN